MTNKVTHVPGEKNASDFLSRSCQPSLGAILPSEPVLDYFRIALAQRSESELDELRLGNLDSNMSFQLVQVALVDNDISLLCDKPYSRLRPIIPKALRPDIFCLYHSWSHPGAKTGIKLVGQRFVWPGMRQDIRKWTQECQACARAKVQRHNISPLSTVTPPPSGRFTNVYVDITGPLGSSNGYNYLLVIIEYSRYMNAIPMVGITAEECVDSFIRHWVSWFGTPEHVYTDRGSQFSSPLWSQMYRFLGTQAHRFTAYHPQAQGPIERLNRTLKTSFKCWEDPTTWHDHLPWVLMALRNSPKDDLAGF